MPDLHAQYQLVIQIYFVATWAGFATKNADRFTVKDLCYTIIIYNTPTMFACHVIRYMLHIKGATLLVLLSTCKGVFCQDLQLETDSHLDDIKSYTNMTIFLYANQKHYDPNEPEGLMCAFKECKITEKQLRGCLKMHGIPFQNFLIA